MIIPPKARLLFIGDSVTDCGRDRTAGEQNGRDLGHGYVAVIDATLKAATANPALSLLNTGAGGDTVINLKARWADDVFVLKPDWLSVMIGINDVWRQYDGLAKPADQVMPELFERTYNQLLESTRSGLKGLVLMTPYYVEASRSERMRQRMDEYGKIVKRLAASHRAILVDTQAAFDHALTQHAFTDLAPDRVHPTELGHKILAETFLAAVGFGDAIH